MGKNFCHEHAIAFCVLDKVKPDLNVATLEFNSLNVVAMFLFASGKALELPLHLKGAVQRNLP